MFRRESVLRITRPTPTSLLKLLVAHERMHLMSIRDQIRNFVEESFILHGTQAVLRDSDSLMDTGRVDSTGVLALVAYVEETFGVEVGDDELVPENFDTVDRIVHFLEKKRQETAA